MGRLLRNFISPGGSSSAGDADASAGRGPILVGVVHLDALPGSPRFEGSMGTVLEHAAEDAEALAAGGADAVIVENFGDVPFERGSVDPETVAAMALAVDRVQARFPEGPVGVNVLRNDARAALGICAATGASFLRVNVLTGAAVTDQGVIEGEAAELLRERRRLGLDVSIWADVHVKHAVPLGGGDLRAASRDLVERGLADVVIVSGEGTGRPTSSGDLAAVRDACPEVPLAVGSGVEPSVLGALVGPADALIVGTWLKGGGGRRVDADRVAELRRQIEAQGR